MAMMVGLAAKMMTREELVDRLQEAIDKFKNAKLLNEDGKDEFQILAYECSLIIVKHSGIDPFDMAERVDKAQKNEELLKPGKS